MSVCWFFIHITYSHDYQLSLSVSDYSEMWPIEGAKFIFMFDDVCIWLCIERYRQKSYESNTLNNLIACKTINGLHVQWVQWRKEIRGVQSQKLGGDGSDLNDYNEKLYEIHIFSFACFVIEDIPVLQETEWVLPYNPECLISFLTDS